MGKQVKSILDPIAGACGLVLLVSLFLPWAEGSSGWDASPAAAFVCVLAGLAAITCAVTRGRVGFFRPDVSVRGAADLLAVAAAAAIAGYLIFGLPEGASAEAGVYVSLVAAIATFSVVGDYSPFRGAPAFPRLDAGEHS